MQGIVHLPVEIGGVQQDCCWVGVTRLRWSERDLVSHHVSGSSLLPHCLLIIVRRLPVLCYSLPLERMASPGNGSPPLLVRSRDRPVPMAGVNLRRSVGSRFLVRQLPG